MSLDCRDLVAIPGCANMSGQPGIPVTIHYEYRDNGAGVTSAPVVRYTNADGSIFIPPAGYVVTAGACAIEAREFDHVILCDPVTGDKVTLVIAYDAGTGVPHPVAYNMDGTPWGGLIPALVACPDSDAESDPVVMCDGTTTFIRWVVKKDGVPTGVFFDTDTAMVSYAPVGPAVPGQCGTVGDMRVYIERSIDDVSMADIAATTGSKRVLSVTVKQIVGNGEVHGDTGSGAPMSAGETWSWSAVSDGNTDTLVFSSLRFHAGTGEQHITATYLP